MSWESINPQRGKLFSNGGNLVPTIPERGKEQTKGGTTKHLQTQTCLQCAVICFHLSAIKTRANRDSRPPVSLNISSTPCMHRGPGYDQDNVSHFNLKYPVLNVLKTGRETNSGSSSGCHKWNDF